MVIEPATMVCLICVNLGDIASWNQAKFLLNNFAWKSLGNVEGKAAHSYENVRMWLFENGILFEDYIGKRWHAETGEVVDEIIFPSRHSASSGKPSLTLHPIGVPHLELGEVPPFGGKSGEAPPPSTRIAEWWRLLQSMAAETELDQSFELTLEVTHHGPYIEVPSLFIEIGSTNQTWPHIGAAELLADIIAQGLGLKGDEGLGEWKEEEHSGQLVVVTLGGGHYAPRANKLGSMQGIWIGHMLATYALPFIKPESEGEIPGGTWKQAIDAALKTTKQSFPGGNIVCSMDKKAFRGWQRQGIRDHLQSIGIPLLTTKQITELLNQ